jgi:protein ImuB
MTGLSPLPSPLPFAFCPLPLFCCLVADPARPPIPGVLESVARLCSPRVEPHGETAVVFDASGLTRVLGPPADIAREVTRLAQEQGQITRVAIAGTSTAAWLLAHARTGPTIVAPGHEATSIASIPLGWLGTLPIKPSGSSLVPISLLAILERWGVRTLGDLAALPRSDVHARLGPLGVRWHQAASGEDTVPLTPAGETVRFVERLELEWPIEGLEPLTFVMGRVCDALAITLENADRGAVEVTTRLHLVTREVHERVLHLPAPMREARVLRTLVLLDIESHPPPAAIDVVEVELAVVRGRIVQGSLLTRALPSPEDLATLIARLGALMGESRIGAPVIVDSHDDRTIAMGEFKPLSKFEVQSSKFEVEHAKLPPVLRRLRIPLAARVVVDHGTPVDVESPGRARTAGRVLACAGPWRSSGRWWRGDRTTWDRDEWDVELADGVYRIARDRKTGGWTVEGLLD